MFQSEDFSTFSNLSSDFYQLSVEDANGCLADISEIKVGEPGKIESTNEVSIDLSCYQSGDGKIEAITSGGVAPYAYELFIDGNSIADGTIFESFDILELNYLDVGNYSIEVTDYNDCIETFIGMDINQPDEIIADFILSEVLINKGFVQEQLTEISGEFNEGDSVVINGHHNLKENALVEILNAKVSDEDIPSSENLKHEELSETDTAIAKATKQRVSKYEFFD